MIFGHGCGRVGEIWSFLSETSVRQLLDNEQIEQQPSSLSCGEDVWSADCGNDNEPLFHSLVRCAHAKLFPNAALEFFDLKAPASASRHVGLGYFVLSNG